MNRSDIAVVSVSEVWSMRPTFEASLTPFEAEVFGELSIGKRMQDWLAGRVAAKRAAQRKLGLPFQQIEIRTEEGGRPQIFLADRKSDLFLSITHSNDVAAAIASRSPIGLDLERIEPRDHTFEDLVLTAADRQKLDGLVGARRDEWLTLLWCEKEAYAKLTGNGLRIPFAELVVPENVAIERGTIELGGVPYAFAISTEMV